MGELVTPLKGLQIRSTSLSPEEDSETVQHVTDPASVSPGDSIVYSVTHEVNYGSGEKMWIKFGSSTTVRSNETPQAAQRRLVDYVHSGVAQSIHEAIEHTRSI